MVDSGEYVYKKEVDWSLLMEGLTLPVENQVVFGRVMNRFLQKGEKKEIKLYLNGKAFDAKIVNVNYNSKFNRKSDVLQIRYPRNGSYKYHCNFHLVKDIKRILYFRQLL